MFGLQLYYCKGNSGLHGFLYLQWCVTFFYSVSSEVLGKILLPNFATSIKTNYK